MDQLFHLTTSKFPQETWFKMFKTPSDMTTFLRLFCDCFHIQSNLVTLLQKPRLSDSHIQRAQSRDNQVVSASSIPASLQMPPSSAARTQSPLTARLQNIQQAATVDFKLNEPVSNNFTNSTATTASTKSEPNSGGFESLGGSAGDINSLKVLDNLCEKNCPSITTGSYYSSNASTPTHVPVPAVVSSNGSPATAVVPATEGAKPAAKNQTLKQRINNLVIKTLAENLEKDKHSMTAIQTNAQLKEDNKAVVAASNTPAVSSTTPTTVSPSNANYFMGDTWKIKILQNTRVIQTIKDCLFVTEAILKSAQNEQVVISFDCEGINLGVKGQLTLVEIGTTRGEAFIFDVLTCPEMVQDGGLKLLLENENVIKVIHDCRNDSVNLNKQFGILMRNVFDTQSAHAVLQFQNHQKQVYKVKNVSLNTLCEIYGAPINPMKDQLKNVYRRDQKYWARRPLTRDMLLYAAGDVLVLINELLYANMANSITVDFRTLFSELCTEQILMLVRPVEVKLRKKQRKINTEVADLKLKLAQCNKNIVLSNREIRLLRYLDLTEEEKEKLKGSYKVAKKLEKLENIGHER